MFSLRMGTKRILTTSPSISTMTNFLLQRKQVVGVFLCFWCTIRPSSSLSMTMTMTTTMTASASAITIPAPVGLSYFPFQDDVIKNYLVPSQRILLGDEMGLGKTISVIGGMNILLRDRCVHDGQKQQQHGDESSSESEAKKPFQALIIAPKSVLSHWEDELHKWITIDNDEDDEKNNEKFKFKIVVIKAKQGIPNIHDENDDGDGGDESSTSSSSSSSLSCVVYLINYEIVNKYRTEIDSFGKIDLLVCDECHYLKSVDTQRTQAVFGHHIHTESIKPISTERLWLVTGSPVLNNPSELFPLLNAIDLEKEIFPELESLDAFREQYCRKQVSPWGIYYKGGKNLSELRNRLSKVSTTAKRSTPIMIRRTKKEVLTELPDKRHQLFPLDDGGEASRLENNKLQEILQQLEAKDNKTGLKQEKEGIGTDITSITLFTTENLQKVKVVQLKDLLKVRDLHISGRKSELIQRLIEYEATSTTTKIDDTDVDEEEEKAINDEEITTIRNSALSALQSAPSENRSKVLSKILGFQTDSKTAVLGALMKARHQTALSKVPYAIELLEIATSSHKVVVFAHHRDVQDAIYDAFKDRAVVLNGDTSMEDRSIAVHRFQTDPSVTLFIGSIRAAGLGITLTAASHVVFIEMDWSPLIVQQAEDRCHRVGQKSSVLVQYLFFRNTVDEHISQLLASKQSTVSAAMDEPKGVTGWVFDFGKHQEKTIFDVAGEDSVYLKWIVENDVHLEKDKSLTVALIELGYLNQQGEKFLSQLTAEIASTDTETSTSETDGDEEDQAGNFVLTFGKHKNKPLRDVPKGYLFWMSSSGAARGNYKLLTALRKHLSSK